MRIQDFTDAPSTSLSLIDALKADSAPQVAWPRFVETYGPHILDWCRSYRLQDADARDVTQEVLLRLAQYLPAFQYDSGRRFRGWLHTIVHHCFCDWIKEHRRDPAGSGDPSLLGLLESLPAREALADRLQQQFDCERLHLAMERVRNRVEPLTWQVFELLALQRLTGSEVALQTGMKVASAFAARSKVQRLLRQELELLDRCEAVAP